jgi:hypothetical protein
MVSADIDLEATARECGVLRRRREIRSAEDLLRLGLVYGPGGLSLRDTAAWAAGEGIANMSKTALLYRLRDAAPWFEHILGALLARRAAEEGEPDLNWLDRRVRLVDGSTVTSRGKAQDWRLHAVYDLSRQRFDTLELTDKTQAEALERMAPVQGDLVIADRCYARPGGLAHIVESGGDFLIRTGMKSLRMQHLGGERVDLQALLDRSKAKGGVDLIVEVMHASKKDWVPIKARLVILPKPRKAAQDSRRKALRASQRGGHQSDPLSLESAEHLMLITSLSRKEATPAQLRDAYRLRWQIELAFKRLKTLLHIDRLPAVDKGLARTWLTAHLIAILLIEDLIPQLRDSPPSEAAIPVAYDQTPSGQPA